MRKKTFKSKPKPVRKIRFPHDSLFRSVFSDPQNIMGELKALLPKKVVEAIDWTTLHLASGTQFDAFLNREEDDLLFTAQFHSGGEVFLYCLLEHLSTPKYWTVFRLLRYMVRIWETFLAKEGQQEAQKLPVVIPIVMYHNSKPWTHPQNFSELLDWPPHLRQALEPFVPSFRFVLENLEQVPDEELQQRASSKIALLALIALKHLRNAVNASAILARYRDVFLEVRHEDRGFQAIFWVMSYLFQVQEAHSEHEILEMIEHTLGDEFKEIAMTVAEQLIERGVRKGFERGIEQGIEKGIEKGIKQGEANVYDSEGRKLLLALVELKFGPLSAAIRNLIQTGSPQNIQDWSIRTLQATTLAEIFADDWSEST